MGEVYSSRAGDLDHWLTERYCLFSVDRGGTLYRCDIRHASWPLQPAVAECAVNTMGEGAGIELPDVEPLLHFARRVDVVAWSLNGRVDSHILAAKTLPSRSGVRQGCRIGAVRRSICLRGGPAHGTKVCA